MALMASIIQRTLVHAVRRYSQISYQLKPKTFLPKLSNYNVKFYESTGILRALSTQAEANVAEDQNSADATSKKRDFQAETRMLLDIGAKSNNEVRFDSDNSLALRSKFCTYNIRRYSTKTVVKYAENSVESYYRDLLAVKPKDFAEAMELVGRLKESLVQAQGLVGAIAARSGIDDIFLKRIKKFLPVKEPGKRYTGAQIQEAYVTFLATNDNFAVALKEAFPNLSNEALARSIRKIYGKLSKLDHTLLAVLRNVYTPEKVLEVVSMIPAILTKKQLELVEKIVQISIEICEDEDDEEN